MGWRGRGLSVQYSARRNQTRHPAPEMTKISARCWQLARLVSAAPFADDIRHGVELLRVLLLGHGERLLPHETPHHLAESAIGSAMDQNSELVKSSSFSNDWHELVECERVARRVERFTGASRVRGRETRLSREAVAAQRDQVSCRNPQGRPRESLAPAGKSACRC